MAPVRTTLVILSLSSAHAFSPAAPTRVPTALSSSVAASPFQDVQLPDATEIFDKIQQVSPLARSVIEGNNCEGQRAADDASLKWKTVETNRKNPVQEIQKLDHFAGISTPVFRFRSKLQGPCLGEYFGRFIIDLEERRKWDAQIEQVHDLHTVPEPDTVRATMGLDDRYGSCARLGIGYGQTKAGFGITPREQMFLYGMQEFADGSSVIWGTEMSEEYDHLFPDGRRHTRAKSHLFSATLRPNHDDGEHSFDVEYVLQLDIGGSIPNFLTTPVLIDTVKSLFETAQKEFAGATDDLQRFLSDKMQKQQDEWQSLLLPI